MSLQHSVKARIIFLYLVTFLLSTWSLSYYLVEVLRKDLEQQLAEQQYSTLSVIANQIDRAVENRFRALESVATTIAQELAAGPGVVQSRLDRLPIFQTLFNGGVLAHDVNGTAIAETPNPGLRIGVNYIDDEGVANALRQGKRTLGRPVVGKKLRAAVFGMAVPVRDRKGAVTGALTGVVNLAEPNFFDDITRGFYGKTGGYLLVSPRDEVVITASDKRRIMEPLTPTRMSPAKRRLLDGTLRSAIVINRYGVEVLASARTLQDSGWVLIAELPTAEVYAPLQKIQSRILVATLVFSILAGLVTWWVIGRQLQPLRDAALKLAHQPDLRNLRDLPERLPVSRMDEIGQLLARFNELLDALAEREHSLRQSEAFKDVILDSVAAEIAVLDRDGVIRAVNEPWRRFALENSPVAGVPAQGTGIGHNYLQACTSCNGPSSAHASEACAGIRAVLEGRQSSFSLDYPCHSPIRYRWFTMMVMPLGKESHDGVVITHTDISAIKRAEDDLRIAAVAFECQEGILVMDTHRHILRTNQAFTRLTGYSQAAAAGRTSEFLQPLRSNPSAYEMVWIQAERTGSWQGELSIRRTNDEDFPSWVTMTAVRDNAGQTTHYVCTMTDMTALRRQEMERQAADLAQRDALVREVHHRIKNNLQGIMGILRLYVQSHPEVAAPLNQAVGQVRSLAVLHGLQGRTPSENVHLRDLVVTIAGESEAVWHTPIRLNIPDNCPRGIITATEAVPVALILNELIVNAVKHGGKAHGQVTITLREGASPGTIDVCIHNRGRLARKSAQANANSQLGMILIKSLMPRSGAWLDRRQEHDEVVVCLTLGQPVIL